MHNPATPTGFHAVAMTSPAEVWAAGGDAVHHWDGHDARWTSAVPASGATLLGIDAAAGHVWAVGIGPDEATFIAHRCS
jgi:hypothetical protein